LKQFALIIFKPERPFFTFGPITSNFTAAMQTSCEDASWSTQIAQMKTVITGTTDGI